MPDPSFHHKSKDGRYYVNKVLIEKDIKLHNMDMKRKWQQMNEPYT